MTSGRSSASWICTASAALPSSSTARGMTSATLVGWGCTPSAPACRRLMSSRFSTSRVSRSKDSSAVARSSCRSLSSNITLGVRSPWTAAFAEASGARRSWLTARSRAVRSLSASAIGPRRGGLLGEALLSQGEGSLNGEGLDDALVGGVEGPALQHQRERVVDGHLDVALLGAPRRRERRRFPRRSIGWCHGVRSVTRVPRGSARAA